MRIDELLNEENWLSKAWNTVLHGTEDKLIGWVEDNIRQKGTQWIYRNVDKKFPKRYVKSDVDKAIKQVLSKTKGRA